MQYRRLGRTGLDVSAVSLGGLFFGSLAAGRDTARTVRTAADLGINLIDTAAAYDGSEEELGRALTGGLRRRFVLVTKWWPYRSDGRTMRLNPSEMRAAVDGSLRRLRTDRIDVLLFHSLTHDGDIDRVRCSPLLAEFRRLRAAGKVRFLGCSNSGEWDRDDVRLQEAARSGAFDVVMPEFLLFRQRPATALFPVTVRHGVGTISIIPLGQAAWGYGLRDRKYLMDSLKTLMEKGKLPRDARYEREDILDFLMTDGTTTVPGAALRFCLSHPELSTVCCGTNDPAHLEANAAVADLPPYAPAQLARARELFGMP